MKSVLILYPISPYLDKGYSLDESGGFTCYRNSLCLDFFVEGFARALGKDPLDLRKRSNIYNLLLSEYRDQGYVVTWAFFSQPREKPELSVCSDLFDVRSEDYIIPVGVTYEEMCLSKYPCERQVLASLKGLQELVVGGFHRFDCVQRFVLAARLAGISAFLDELLTEEFFLRVIQSFSLDVDAHLLRTGFLDPLMHENDLETERRVLLGERICKYFKDL